MIIFFFPLWNIKLFVVYKKKSPVWSTKVAVADKINLKVSKLAWCMGDPKLPSWMMKGPHVGSQHGSLVELKLSKKRSSVIIYGAKDYSTQRIAC